MHTRVACAVKGVGYSTNRHPMQLCSTCDEQVRLRTGEQIV